jgi:hypothetical protein
MHIDIVDFIYGGHCILREGKVIVLLDKLGHSTESPAVHKYDSTRIRTTPDDNLFHVSNDITKNIIFMSV